MQTKTFVEEFFEHLDILPGSKIELEAVQDKITLSFTAPNKQKYICALTRPAYDNNPQTLQDDILRAISVLAYGSRHDSSGRGGLRI